MYEETVGAWRRGNGIALGRFLSTVTKYEVVVEVEEKEQAGFLD